MKHQGEKIMRKNKIQNFLLKQAEVNRQFMVLGAVLFLTGLMSINLLGIIRAGTTDNTNVALNVSAGALSLDYALPQVNFNSGGIGDPVTANTGTNAQNTNSVVVNDTSGSGNGWTLSAYYNAAFTSAGANTMTINDDNLMLVLASGINIINNTGQSGDVQAGADFNFNATGAGALNTIATAAAQNGQGCFDIYQLVMNYNIPLDAVATNYTTQMIFTVA